MLSSIMKRLNERRAIEYEGGGSESGFTLIELMVVLLIMAILLAIAIPTFLGVKGSAQDRAAQSNLNTALTNAKAAYENNGQSYNAVTVNTTLLQSNEPSLTWTTGAATTGATGTVSVASLDVNAPADGQGIILATESATGYCWVVADITATPAVVTATSPDIAWGTTTAAGPGPGTFYGYANPGTSCTASTFNVDLLHWHQNSFPPISAANGPLS